MRLKIAIPPIARVLNPVLTSDLLTTFPLIVPIKKNAIAVNTIEYTNASEVDQTLLNPET